LVQLFTMKILLFTNSLLTDSDSSWLLLSKMLSRMTEHEIIIFSSNHLLKTRKIIQYCDVIHYSLILNTPLIKKIINQKWEKLNLYIALFYAKILARKIHQIVDRKSIDKLWINNGVLTVLTLTRLLKKPFIPYHVSIFDDPLHNRNYKVYGERLENDFVEILKTSTSLDVTVPDLKDYYVENRFIQSTHPVGISHGGYFKESIKEEIEIRPQVKKICLTGHIFWLESFLVFCSAVEKVCMDNGIEIHVFSNKNSQLLLRIKKRLEKYSDFVSIKPFVPENEIIDTITKYDLAYIQMSFHKDDKHKCITSFPSKTYNYLSSTVPILLHSPDYAAISKFLKGSNLCHSINTIRPDEIDCAFKGILNFAPRNSIHKNVIEFNNRPNINSHFDNLIKIIGANI